MTLEGDLCKQVTQHLDDSKVTDLAKTVMGLMRSNEAKLIRQARQLIKQNRELACKVFTRDIDGWTPIHACALRGSRKLLKVLLGAKMDVNTEMGHPKGLPGRCTLLHLAAHRGDLKIVELLLSREAHVSAQDSTGRTPIYYASEANHLHVVNYLTDKGADGADVCSPRDQTADCITPQPKLTKFCFLPVKCAT